MAKLAKRFLTRGGATLTLLATSVVWSSGSTTQPYPPGSLCVNGKCAAAATSAAAAAGVKWHPGHYLDSAVFTGLGNIDSSGNAAGPEKATEIALVRNSPAQVLGYEAYYYWRALENQQGTIDGSSAGSGLDADYTAITGYQSGNGPAGTAVYKSPRRLGIYILHTDYFNSAPNGRSVPDYIANSSTYGPVGPDGVHYGYWTTTGAQGPGGGSVVAWWRPAVEARFAAMLNELANHVLPDGYTVDTSPYVEWVKPYLESTDEPMSSSTCIDACSDPTWASNNNAQAQYQALHASMSASFPHTITVAPINFFTSSTSNIVGLIGGLPSARAGEGGPDIFGYSTGQNVGSCGTCGLTHGQMAYIGLVPGSGGPFGGPWVSGGTDLRGTVPYVGTIQGTEMIADYGGHYTPQDLFKQADTTLHATHIAWTYLSPTFCSSAAGQNGTGASPQCNVTTDVKWFGTATSAGAWTASNGGVLAEIVSTPISHTACPTSYTNGCNTN